MNITNQEKELIRFLIKKELKTVKKSEEDIRPHAKFFAAEEKYENFLEELLKKL